ncbi:MAG TPA: hypothetical protein VGQ69_06745 [Gemmatimonadales bacterium]|jgi:hypothetical protein|nr:hypothetical protein [Gemmatimonadales bacterium]
MVIGRRYWILIWYGILLLGLLGLGSSLYWGRRTHWRNLDELIRACGTILVSLGMLLLLKQSEEWLGQLLLVVALLCFLTAFILGRKLHLSPPGPDDTPDQEPRNRA